MLRTQPLGTLVVIQILYISVHKVGFTFGQGMFTPEQTRFHQVHFLKCLIQTVLNSAHKNNEGGGGLHGAARL